MKKLLILCLIYWATVSANTESFRTTEHKEKRQNTFVQYQKNYFGNVTSRISESDIEFTSLVLSSHLLFDSFISPYPLLLFDLSTNSDNNFYSHNPFLITDKKNRVRHHSSSIYFKHSLPSNIDHTSENKNDVICWNKVTLAHYVNDKLSNINLPAHSKPEQNTLGENDFMYAGTKRFTLSGDPPNLSTDIKLLQASLTGLVVVVTGIALHNNQSVAWWDGKGRSFYIQDDWDNALYADKFGHFMGGYFTAYCAREAFIFSGFSWKQSILLGSILGLVTQSYIEFKDGYAENTGFSPSDFVADFAGVTYFYLQHYIPILQNFSPKWQYEPPAMIGVPPAARTQTFLDNYNSTTAWVSIQVRNLFWGEKKSFWPKWLNIGVGYGINGYYTSEMSSRFVIGIDYNIVELLPDGVPFWNWIKQTLNCLKFPAPAIEFSNQGTQFKLLYPFTISVDSFQF
jgi:hypothetical protein